MVLFDSAEGYEVTKGDEQMKKNYAEELVSMNTGFDAFCKKYNHTGVAVVTERKGNYFLSSVNSDTKEELDELIIRGFDMLVSAMFTSYGTDRLKEARDFMGDMLNRKYSLRLQQRNRTNERKDGRMRGSVLHCWTEKGLLLILGDDKKRYIGHWDFEKKGNVKQSKKVYFYIGEPEVLPDGSISQSLTALDVKRFSELDDSEES